MSKTTNRSSNTRHHPLPIVRRTLFTWRSHDNTLWSMRPMMINARVGQVRERVAITGRTPGEAGRVQRLPHLEPPRSVRRRLPLTGPAYDGPDTPAVEVTASFVSFFLILSIASFIGWIEYSNHGCSGGFSNCMRKAACSSSG